MAAATGGFTAGTGGFGFSGGSGGFAPSSGSGGFSPSGGSGGFAPSGGTPGPTSMSNPGLQPQKTARLEDAFLGGAARFALPGQGKETGIAGAPMAPKWNGYFSWTQSSIGNTFQPLQNSGTVRVVTLGIDYSFPNDVVAGLAISGSKANVDIQAVAGGKVTGDGMTYAPYIAAKLNPNWSVDATVGFGRNKMKYSDSTQSGSFNDNNSLYAFGASYRRIIAERWMITGRAAYLNVSDRLDAYTMAGTGMAVSANNTRLGQMRLGGQAAYNAGNVIPYAGLTYINDVHRTAIGTINGLTAADDRDAWQWSLGLRFATPVGVYGAIQYATDKGRSQIKNDQVQLNLGMRF